MPRNERVTAGHERTSTPTKTGKISTREIVSYSHGNCLSLAAKLIKIWGMRRRFSCLAGERQSLRAVTEGGGLGLFLEHVKTGFSSE